MGSWENRGGNSKNPAAVEMILSIFVWSLRVRTYKCDLLEGEKVRGERGWPQNVVSQFHLLLRGQSINCHHSLQIQEEEEESVWESESSPWQIARPKKKKIGIADFPASAVCLMSTFVHFLSFELTIDRRVPPSLTKTTNKEEERFFSQSIVTPHGWRLPPPTKRNQ